MTGSYKQKHLNVLFGKQCLSKIFHHPLFKYDYK